MSGGIRIPFQTRPKIHIKTDLHDIKRDLLFSVPIRAHSPIHPRSEIVHKHERPPPLSRASEKSAVVHVCDGIFVCVSAVYVKEVEGACGVVVVEGRHACEGVGEH